ncbi:E3 ubiquitin ligase family protein [Haloarchaeobius salinus]|uniref:E3 ubiquitin ligase family protein n=1 Tax=Haloarchaeobius salinus TaxID=1198298 RepID=UPI00210C8E1E|nr:E3 ubiquitin ligase family protein [Haloarchaeobius salinus]
MTVTPFHQLSILAGLLALGYGAVVGAKVYRISRDEPIPTYRLRHGGTCEVEGVAGVHEETVSAPFTGTDCLVCRWTVEEYQQSGKHSHWKTVDSGVWSRPFVLADDTGRVLVEPDGAAFSLAEDDTVEVDGGDAPPRRVQQFIGANDRVDDEDRELDLGIVTLSTGNDRRYVEERLDPGDSAYVFGYARANRRPGSGVEGVVAGPPADRGGSHLDRLFGPLFLVSDTTERGVLRRLRWKVFVPGLLGVALVAVGLSPLAL